MKRITDEAKLFEGILDLISRHFGDNTEVVLHDFSSSNPHSILSIRNGHITDRDVGDCADKHGIQVVSGEMIDGDLYNEIIYTEEGKILRGSTFSIRDEGGTVIGSICINQDLTESVKYEKYLRQINGFYPEHSQPPDINEALTQVIQEAFIAVGKHTSAMTREDKLNFIKFLDDRGAFLISKSGQRICQTLDISKFTLYDYLKVVRNGADGEASEE